jgi:hypothetical protein
MRSWSLVQVPRFPVLRNVPSVRIHSPVHSVQAPRSCRARVGNQSARMDCAGSALLISGASFRPRYPAPSLCTVSPVHQHNPVRPVPAPLTCRATGGIQPGRVVPALCSRHPVRLRGPVYPAPTICTMPPVRLLSPVRPVPAFHTHRAKVGIQPGHVVAAPRTRLPVSLLSPVRPVPAPRTKPPVMIHGPSLQ